MLRDSQPRHRSIASGVERGHGRGSGNRWEFKPKDFEFGAHDGGAGCAWKSPPGRALGSDRMAVLSRPIVIGSLAIVLGVAVAIPVLATLAFAAIGHPECATIPEDVGPCGYWARVAEYGPFIMLWGTVVTAGFGVTVWLVVVAVLGFFAALRPRRD